MATFAALDIKEIFTKKIELTTFGMPRMGNKEFALYAFKKIPDARRVVHYRDTVVGIPGVRLGYNHIATEY